MKLLDAILNVNCPEAKHHWDYSVNAEEICDSLHIEGIYYFPEELNKRFKAYPVLQWICTDTHVGLYALYLDGNPVGATYKNARKNNPEIKWISHNTAELVRATILSYLEKPAYDIIDPNQDIGEDFTVNYIGQLLTDKGFYKGEPVRVLIKYDWCAYTTTPEGMRSPDRPYTVKVDYKDARKDCMMVRNQNNEDFLIHVSDFRMKFNVKETSDAVRK